MKKVLKGCPICARYQARPFTQEMAPLRADRIEASRAFQAAGVDFFGPLATTSFKKTYGCIFTCPASRAAHI